VVQVVGFHQLDGLAAEDTHAVEFASVQQHLPEARVVADRREHARAAPRHGAVERRHDELLHGLERASSENYQKQFVKRRTTAQKERLDPPYAMKKLSFCNAQELSAPAPTLE
jgi:hypothetical protein